MSDKQPIVKAIGEHRGGMAAMMVAAIDQDTSNTLRTHLAEGDFLFAADNAQ